MSAGHVHNHGAVAPAAKVSERLAPTRSAANEVVVSELIRTLSGRRARTDAFVAPTRQVSDLEKNGAAYIDWVKSNLPQQDQAAHLNGADGKPSALRAKNVYKFIKFYENTLKEHGVDLKKDIGQYRDMVWHTLHAFMDEAKTFSGDMSFDFLGKRLTLRGEGTTPPTEEQLKKLMGHFFHISGHVTNRPDVATVLQTAESKEKLAELGVDPLKPGNLVYWNNASKLVSSGSDARIAQLGLSDSGYSPNITDVKPRIAKLGLSDSSYAPTIEELNESNIDRLSSAHSAAPHTEEAAEEEECDEEESPTAARALMAQVTQVLVELFSLLGKLFARSQKRALAEDC